MTNHYFDPSNATGAASDGNAGTSDTAPKLNLQAVTTAVGGDVIYAMKSPDPVKVCDGAVFTQGNKNVILPAAVTQMVADGETQWTAAANVTATRSTSRKYGSYSAQIAIGAAHGTGKAAYVATGDLDLSSYGYLTFWFYKATSGDLADGTISLRLCSDTTGDVSVYTFAIPATVYGNAWQAVTIQAPSALSTTIKSIALYVDTDTGAQTFLFDNVQACNGLSLTSLVSANSAVSGGTELWYTVTAISGTTLVLGRDISELATTTNRGYDAATKTTALYRRETNKLTAVASDSASMQYVSVSGTGGSRIGVKGGWDWTTHAQNGETWWDAQNGHGYVFDASDKDWLAVEKIGCVNGHTGLWLSSGIERCTFTNVSMSGNKSYNLYGSALFDCQFTTVRLCGSATYGASVTGSAQWSDVRCHNAGSYYGMSFYGAHYVENLRVSYNGYGVYSAYGEQHIHDFESIGNATAAFYQLNGTVRLSGTISIAETTWIGGAFPSAPGVVSIQAYGGDVSDNRVYCGQTGYWQSETAGRYTPVGLAWRGYVTSAYATSDSPMTLDVAGGILCQPGITYSVQAWMKRSNTGLSARLALRIADNPFLTGGVDLTSAMTAAADTWELVTLSFSVTQACVVKPKAEAYGGTTYNVVVQFIPSQAETWWGQPILSQPITVPRKMDMGVQRQLSSTTQPVSFFMADSADHLTGKASLAPTVTLSKNGGGFAAAAGAVSEIGNGWYSLAANATDRNTLGALVLRATATGADTAMVEIEIVGWDPFDGVHGGMTALPDAAAGAENGLPLADAAGKVAATVAEGDCVDAAALVTTIGEGGAGLTDLGDTRIGDILEDTGELQADWSDGGRLDLNLDAILEDTGTTIPAAIKAAARPVNITTESTIVNSR